MEKTKKCNIDNVLDLHKLAKIEQEFLKETEKYFKKIADFLSEVAQRGSVKKQ